jgi:hypothetical protein
MNFPSDAWAQGIHLNLLNQGLGHVHDSRSGTALEEEFVMDYIKIKDLDLQHSHIYTELKTMDSILPRQSFHSHQVSIFGCMPQY